MLCLFTIPLDAHRLNFQSSDFLKDQSRIFVSSNRLTSGQGAGQQTRGTNLQVLTVAGVHLEPLTGSLPRGYLLRFRYKFSNSTTFAFGEEEGEGRELVGHVANRSLLLIIIQRVNFGQSAECNRDAQGSDRDPVCGGQEMQEKTSSGNGSKWMYMPSFPSSSGDYIPCSTCSLYLSPREMPIHKSELCVLS